MLFKVPDMVLMDCIPGPLHAICIRGTCKEGRDVIDTHLLSLTKCVYLYYITGLPLNLKPAYYCRLLANYFGGEVKKHKCELNLEIGNCLPFEHRLRNIKSVMLDKVGELSHTLKGRRMAKEVFEDWLRCLNSKGVTVHDDVIKQCIHCLDVCLKVRSNATITMGITSVYGHTPWYEGTVEDFGPWLLNQ